MKSSNPTTLDALMGDMVRGCAVLRSRYFEVLPPRKIAEQTGATVEAVKKQLSRGP